MQHEFDEGFENLQNIEDELGCYGPGGFCYAVGTRSGQIAKRYLSLDQSMIVGGAREHPAGRSAAGVARNQ